MGNLIRLNFICHLCLNTNKTPLFYYSELDNNNLYREDINQRNELINGSYEILVGDDYSNNLPKYPTYLFLIDINQNSIEKNILYYTLLAIKELIFEKSLNGQENCKIGIVFFDKYLHILNMNTNTPSILTINSKYEETPIKLNEFYFNIEELEQNETKLNFIDKLPLIFYELIPKSSEYDFELLKLNFKFINKILINSCTKIVTIFSPNKGMNNSIINEKDTKSLYLNSYFNEIIKESLKNQCSFDLYTFSNNKFLNLNSWGSFVKYSGGNFHNYNDIDDESLITFFNDFKYNNSKKKTWESVFRLRTSQGWDKYSYGNYFSSASNDLLKIPNIEEDYTLLYDFKINTKFYPEKIQNKYFAVQTSLLYTDENRRRLIRIHNYVIPLENSWDKIYNNIDIQVCTSVFFKKFLHLYNNPENLSGSDIYSMILKDLINFYKSIAQNSSKEFNEEILPILAIYIFGITKNKVFLNFLCPINANKWLDNINYLRIIFNQMDIDQLNIVIYPTIFNIDSINEDNCEYNSETWEFTYPENLRLTSESLLENNITLIDNGFIIYIFINTKSNKSLIDNFFNYESLNTITEENIKENLYGIKLINLISEIRSKKRSRYSCLKILVDEIDEELQYCLYEDKNKQSEDKIKLSFNEFYNIHLKNLI